MDFTYDGYCSLLSLIEQSGYEIVDYKNWEEKKRCVILRHDNNLMNYGKMLKTMVYIRMKSF